MEIFMVRWWEWMLAMVIDENRQLEETIKDD